MSVCACDPIDITCPDSIEPDEAYDLDGSPVYRRRFVEQFIRDKHFPDAEPIDFWVCRIRVLTNHLNGSRVDIRTSKYDLDGETTEMREHLRATLAAAETATEPLLRETVRFLNQRFSQITADLNTVLDKLIDPGVFERIPVADLSQKNTRVCDNFPVRDKMDESFRIEDLWDCKANITVTRDGTVGVKLRVYPMVGRYRIRELWPLRDKMHQATDMIESYNEKEGRSEMLSVAKARSTSLQGEMYREITRLGEVFFSKISPDTQALLLKK